LSLSTSELLEDSLISLWHIHLFLVNSYACAWAQPSCLADNRCSALMVVSVN
jgi:hypothetical protein